MTRLALETLGIKSGLAAVDTAETLPVTPGVWRLATWFHGFVDHKSQNVQLGFFEKQKPSPGILGSEVARSGRCFFESLEKSACFRV